MFAKHALIVGVTGIVGNNLARHLIAEGDWDIYGISRNRPKGLSAVKPIAVDVLDAGAAKTRTRVGGAHAHLLLHLDPDADGNRELPRQWRHGPQRARGGDAKGELGATRRARHRNEALSRPVRVACEKQARDAIP